MSHTPPHPDSHPIFSIFSTPPSAATPGPATPRTETSAAAEKVKSRSVPLLQDRQARGKEPRTGRVVGEEGEGEGEAEEGKRM